MLLKISVVVLGSYGSLGQWFCGITNDDARDLRL